VTKKAVNPYEEALRPLLIKAQAGDRRAYGEALSLISKLARKLVLRKSGQTADADDITQDILLSIHRALHTYDPSRNCLPWVSAIIHYRMNDWLRSHYRKEYKVHIPIEDVEHELCADVTEEAADYEYVNKAVSGLSGNQQAVIASMYHEDLSVKETATKLGMSVSSVKVTAHRAYKKLRKDLGES